MALALRQTDVTGQENIPSDRGVIYASWHPSGMADGGLIYVHSPRPVTYGVKNTLHETPLVRWLVKGLGTVPVYRRQDTAHLDDEERIRRNEESLTSLAQVLADRGSIAMMPEGKSHSNLHLQTPLKKGTARLLLRAVGLEPDVSPPAVVPVGLHYDCKWKWRSRALIEFHEPVDFPPALLESSEGPAAAEQLGSIMDLIQDHLEDAVLGAKDQTEEGILREGSTILVGSDKLPRMSQLIPQRRRAHRELTNEDSDLRRQVIKHREKRKATGLRAHELK